MEELDSYAKDGIRRAERAAEILIHEEDDRAVATYEPSNRQEANAAVRKFGQLFDELPGKFKKSIEAARDSGSLHSSDRLQGLSEIVQNADDTGATEVRLLLTETALDVSHDGNPVRLHHVLGFMIPWLSTKGHDASAYGRFGIGLTTLRSLSDAIEVHCSPYHVRIGSPSITPIDPAIFHSKLQEEGWTTLRIPIEGGSVAPKEIEAWLDQWDDSALLFLRHVSRVTLIKEDGKIASQLVLSRSGYDEISVDERSISHNVSRQLAEASDGRTWIVYDTEVPSPTESSRARKATGETTPISVAFPLQPVLSGGIYAGLPVASIDRPLFVSAQFDPVTSRRDFVDNKWNRDLAPKVAQVWTHAVIDFFRRYPKAAWLAVPISQSIEGNSEWSLIGFLEESIANRAVQWLASQLSFPVPGQGNIRLSDLSVEAKPLEGNLTDLETAKLAGLQATLPSEVRDEGSRWRTVLDGWRSAGADLPQPVSVEQALVLFNDEKRPVESAIALAAVTLEHNLGDRLIRLPCVIARDGSRIVPPSATSPDALTEEVTLLAEQLGIVTPLHKAHLREDKDAATVLSWLKEVGSLIDGSDDRELVYRLAASGSSGLGLEVPLGDEQLKALRDAFELMDPAERQDIGSDVGRAILLEAFVYEGKQRRTINVHPVEAYLPRRIDREPDSFAVAAGQTSGPVWISEKYVDTLRSPEGRRGIGAQRFLRLLGCATAPRVRQHPHLHPRFANPRRGLHKWVSGSPDSREREMQKRGATYTLQDYYSPDLQKVAKDIANERGKRHRRGRAAALLASLGRAWDRHLTDFAEVQSAYDYHHWQMRGQIRAFWLWQVGDIAWLDDESGTPRRPIELRIRTPGNVAIYGKDSPDYLHKELCLPNRQRVLRAIGVPGDPSRSELVDRLRRLRDSSDNGEATLSNGPVRRETAIIYKALAHDLLETTSHSDLSTAQLRGAFEEGRGLLLTNLGWLPPRSVLGGPRIFRDYMAFAPQIEGVEPLWDALNLRKASPGNCLKVIQRIARKRVAPSTEDETVLLETLRALARHYRNGNTLSPSRLTRLKLWTSKGWRRDRPVYATDDHALAKGLGNEIPIWKPGGELEQFQPLPGPLRVESIRPSDAEVVDPVHASHAPEATEMFQKAMNLLREDLSRNDPELAATIQVSWDTLGTYVVHVHPSLSLRLREGISGLSEENKSEINARVDVDYRTVFVRSPSILPRVDGGGRALAAMFEGNSRRLALAWRAACDRAEEGIEPRNIELAKQRDERHLEKNEQEINNRTSAFRERTAANAGANGRSVGGLSPTKGVQRKDDRGPAAASLGPPRVLVEPSSLEIVNPHGRIEKGKSSTKRRSHRSNGLVNPTKDSAPPRNRTPLPAYSDKDKEDVGMDLVHKLLSSDRQEIVDIRSQRNVGADAVDDMKAFYELKVFAGTEPDHVTLTNSEAKRAMGDDKFFLIVVSGVEGVDAQPKVRVFVDPLNQLQQTYSGSITLSGVRSTESLVYDFARADTEVPSASES